ncbi:hypothetical protein LG634_31380 [Streptomyces bambusae]|uniref:hypothetical protein n=1 Tax=Streptomyces bambusae TaxID=1550616 RepID=UPI001CFF58BD|nr:hypothetical protein [Streptomyces bambusae]MCB5169300.1 hypothetical protein [Streptomyces bambusae]
MTVPDAATRPAPAAPHAPAPEPDLVDVERAEAAIVEHYPRLVRIGYLVLPPALGRNRRVLTAHALAQRALPRGRSAPAPAAGTVPGPRRTGDRAGRIDRGYAYVRLRVLRAALEAGQPLGLRAWPRRAQLPPLLPQVWGLRLFPRSGGAEELALDQRLSALGAAGRAALVLTALEGLPESEAVRVLAEAGVADPAAAVAEAAGSGPAPGGLLDSPEFDPCVLQARPTDLMRRRAHVKGAAAAVVAALVCGALVGLPGGGWGADGPAAPPYAQNTAAEQALDPARLALVGPDAWRTSSRTDFSVWPARGGRTDDRALLRRALAVWARPGAAVQVSATPGTPSGPPMGPAQLLYAGEVDQAVVVLLYDGLRVVRYAEAAGSEAGAALDFARTDGAAADTANALVLSRVDGNVRYLTAPWVRAAAVRDLLEPGRRSVPLALAAGITAPVQAPALTASCTAWSALELTTQNAVRMVTDLGELTPARLTSGPPGAPHEVAGAVDLEHWSHTACLLPAVRSHGVRSVNSWPYAQQELPEGAGTAHWVCTRAETWRGTADRVLAQFHAPGARTGAPAARAEGSAACGVRESRVLAGVLWKAPTGAWHLLGAGSAQFTSLTASGPVSGTASGPLLALPARAGAVADLTGHLRDGTRIPSLR